MVLNAQVSYEDLSASRIGSGMVQGWAVILEMNTFPAGWGDLNVNFMNTQRLTDALTALGWQMDHIYLKQDDLSMTNVKSAVEWLISKTSQNDVALFYIFTHGAWMQTQIKWNDWFPSAWSTVNTTRRVLMIDTCRAGAFIEEIRSDVGAHVSMAHCLETELAWAGIPEEGLPIIGSVWNYYLTDALRNSTADTDHNGFVSVEEAFSFSTPLLQKYMNQTVFVVPEFLQEYHNLDVYPENSAEFPHPLIDDQYPGSLYLDLDYYNRKTDLNMDGIINIVDVSIVARAFGSNAASSNWNDIADLDRDGLVNIVDVTLVARDCGRAE